MAPANWPLWASIPWTAAVLVGCALFAHRKWTEHRTNRD